MGRWLAGVLGLVGCAAPPVTQAALLGVAPFQASATAPVALAIAGTHFTAHVVTDFARHQNSVLDATFTAALSPRGVEAPVEVPLLDVSVASPVAMTATVPAGMALGSYDLHVEAPDGQSLLLEDAYRVVASAETVVGFRIELGAGQRARAPWVLALTAIDDVGRVVDGFSGTVTLADQTGTLTPTAAGPFSAGRVRLPVTVMAAAPADTITVTDPLGHRSTSAAFDVNTGLPVSLSIRSAPQSLVVGQCSQPLAVAWLDVFGEAARAEALLSLSMGGGPLDALEFFSDAACAVPAATLAIPAGDASATLYFRTTRAGRPTVRVWSSTLPATSQVQSVASASPAALAIVTPGQVVRAGQCSAPVTAQVQDVYGNAAGASAATAVLVSSTPSAGVLLFGDAACAVPLNSLTILSGEAEATLYFKAASATEFQLSLASPWGSATQVEAPRP